MQEKNDKIQEEGAKPSKMEKPGSPDIDAVSENLRGQVEIVTDLSSQKAMGAEVRKVCNSTRWINMSDKDKGDFRAGGKKLSEIARIFGVKTDNIKISYPFLELGTKIFGEDDPVLRPILELSRFNFRMRKKLKESPRLWAKEIRKLYNPAEWAEMRVEEREKVDIFGRKLHKVARIFGVEGNPVQVNAVHFELGLAIFGENAMLRSKLDEVRSLNEMGKKHDRRKD